MRDQIEIPMVCEDGAVMPSKKYRTDAGWDLYVSREIIIPAGETIDIHTDVYTCIPNGMYGRITGRSSTMRRHRLLIMEAIIDTGYTGELFVSARNMSNHDFHVQKGMRLSQIIFSMLPDIVLVRSTMDGIPITPRGTRGFGSTGI